ncbi:MAG: BglII/BstYI family type II restriction endonuclease [Candidatus Thorarchaeota archaeon]
MRFNEYSHRHGKELLKLLHPRALKEIQTLLKKLAPFEHGEKKGKTVKEFLTPEFVALGWEPESSADFGTDKADNLDLTKWKVAIEMEFSRFESFFRDFFRFMLLYERRVIDVGIIITLDEMAYQRWGSGVPSYKGARASLQRLEDFLKGDYGSIVRIPLWCIGIE